MKFWVAVGGLVLALCGSAAASTEIRPGSDTSLPYETWIAEVQVPTPDARVWVWRDDCPTWPGYNCTNGRAIWLHPLEHNLERTFFHEVGHIFDAQEVRRPERVAYRNSMGLRGRWRVQGETSSAGLQETFAYSYADCALGSTEPVCDLVRSFSDSAPSSPR